MADELPKDAEVKKDVYATPGFAGISSEFRKALGGGGKPERQRGLVFETEKQRNQQFLTKGITKPGRISYDVLRRAANSVHVARICVNSLKSKVTKTPWVIQPIDQKTRSSKKINTEMEEKIKQVTDFFKHPNLNDETFRTLLDKMLEDLLVLDAVSLEKTRYPDGTLAELHFIDSATIRPVYDEFGNQDVLIPLATKNAGQKGIEELPVSYLQIFNNSQYGGPESGDIVAAWPKKDFIHFHAHPQGAIEGFGYGLSPIEGVLSVIAAILNADNYNTGYFEEGAFPPIILQLVGQIDERQVEAFREYMMQELSGAYHRPAIAAGPQKIEMLDLKSKTNRDMEFMEYSLFMAKLACAAFELSPQDIGITDDVNRATAEVQQTISQAKGYASCLHLIKEVINQEIVWKDFGYEDLEFEWVQDDSLDPVDAAPTYKTFVESGIMTMNEVRQKLGEAPYGAWGDVPMIRTTDAYVPVVEDPEADAVDIPQPEDDAEVGGEANYKDQDKVEAQGKAGDKGGKKEPEAKKAMERSLYIQRPVKNAKEIIEWAKSNGFMTTVPAQDMHVTIAFSNRPIDWTTVGRVSGNLTIKGGQRYIERLGNATVLTFESGNLHSRWNEIMTAGASWDYPQYKSHITLSYDANYVQPDGLEPFKGNIVLGGEERTEVKENWVDGIKEVSQKSMFTSDGYKTWMDDRGYAQPFIFCNILSGKGFVIKPPAAVNYASEDLEVELSEELRARKLNVPWVKRMTFVDVQNFLMAYPEVRVQFDNYLHMTPEYDSEKWRAKFGGSRRFDHYMIQDYIDGSQLNNPLLIKNMQREPESYVQAVTDLANLWKAEKEMVLGDRRADQYIITKDKRAWGFDYQFMGNQSRWEDTSESIHTALEPIPMLKKLFLEKIEDALEPKEKSFIDRFLGR